MKLAVCGTDGNAIKIQNILDKLGLTDSVVLYIGPYYQDNLFCDKKCITEEELLSGDYIDDFDAFVLSPEYYGLTREETYTKLRKSKYSDKAIYMPDYELIKKEYYAVRDDIKSFFTLYEEAQHLFYLEFHTADHCNLNCKGCMHFSSIIEKEEFPDFETFKKDIIQLRSIIKYIDIIRILGGEPLLNPELDKYIRATRECYPYANINIVTNGILLKSMSKQLCDCIRDNDIHIHVSLYPPLIKKRDELKSFLEKEHFNYQISEPIEKFTTTYTLNPHMTAGEAKEKCNIFCNNLKNGEIGCCPNVFYTKYFNDFFNENIPYEGNTINIYEVKTAKELREFLKAPNKLCPYCNMQNEFDWETSLKMKTEWVVSEENYE